VTLQEFAQELRKHDWYYAFSDDGRVYRSGQAAEVKLERRAKNDEMHRESRLWELASGYHRAHNQNNQRYENAWRWAGAYLWAHGVALTLDQAKMFVNDKECIDWRAVDEKIEESC
jgi:hypothetical protein